MKIALPTNNKENVASRTGRAKWFAVYTIEANKILSAEYRENPHVNEHGHGEHKHGNEDGLHEHSHKSLVNMLTDCDLLLLRHAGKFMKNDLKAAGINYEFIKTDDAEEAVAAYLN